MHDLYWLMAASALVWCGLSLYLFVLHRRSARLAARILLLERGRAPEETA